MLNQTALTLNNITWLLAALAFVIAPHITRLPWWVTAVCVSAGVWRWWIARRGLRSPAWWVMAALAIAVTAGAYLEYRRLFGREVGVTLLVAMLCLKVLEMKMKRDAMLVVFLGFFLAMTNFLYSQTIFMGAYMLICVWVFVATLIGFNRINTEATIRERVVPSAWLLLQSVPMMFVLFFLFPRISGPLWTMPQENRAISGLGDNMSPGDISKLSLSDEVAFRVDFENAVPENQDLYWRGPVLGRQVGKAWQPLQVAETQKLNYEPRGPLTKYRVTLQPHNKPWLFALDLPNIAPPDSLFLADFQMRARMPVTSLMAYEMESHLRYRAGTALRPREREAYLRYDDSLNPRTIAYGKKLAQDYSDPKSLVDSLFKLYNAQFTYTLEPPLLGDNPMDEFLFDTKQGFCEHYSSSFVLLLRAAGIPARVVTGYQGGEVNPITRQLVVRQADAHAWSEVWFDDLGWLRADPTSAVSPLRINQGMNAALGPQGMFNTLIDADKFGLLKQIRFSWDAVNSQWNKWVVGFNSDKQRSMFENFGLPNVDWAVMLRWLIIGVIATSSLIGLFLLLRIYRVRKDPVVATYDRLCAKLAKAGITRAPNEGPIDFLQRVKAIDPELGKKVQPLMEAYIAIRYGAPQIAKSSTDSGKINENSQMNLQQLLAGIRRLRVNAS
jgi:protein-glutamine gamma-glutamyltransferase